MIAIYPVHFTLAPRAFVHFGNQLMRGLVKSGESIKEMAKAVVDGRSVMWVVFDNGKPAASFLTTGGADDDGAYLLVYALGGRGVWRFARIIESEMIAHARAEGLQRIRFYGRKAWARLMPICREVGEKSGHTLYEWRDVQ